MREKAVSCLMLISLLLSILLACHIQPIKASGTIIVRADGSIDPPTAPISTSNNITYTITGNIYETVIIERDNITMDGSGLKLEGSGTGYGFDCHAENVTIKNANVESFSIGIHTYVGSSSKISGNNITTCDWGVMLDVDSDFSTIFKNNIVNCNGIGVWLFRSSNCTIFGNNVTSSGIAIRLHHSSESNAVFGNNLFLNTHGLHIYQRSKYNVVFENNITSNADIGVVIEDDSASNTVFRNDIVGNYRGLSIGISSPNNMFYHNNFLDNTQQVDTNDDSVNVWANDYPSGGNYWSDYAGNDVFSGPYQNATGSDGIGDIPYVVDDNNQDEYPLMSKWFLGDVNHDGIVDIFDIGVISAHWYPGPPVGPLGYSMNADINGDGSVDIFDIGITSAHWGQTW